MKREKKDGQTKRIYEATPKAPYQRLLESADLPEATKLKLRDQHAKLDPFELKKNMELKLKKFFTALENLNREATKLSQFPPPVTFSRESTRPPAHLSLKPGVSNSPKSVSVMV